MSPFQCHIYGQEYILTLADWQNFRPSDDPLRCAQEHLPRRRISPDMGNYHHSAAGAWVRNCFGRTRVLRRGLRRNPDILCRLPNICEEIVGRATGDFDCAKDDTTEESAGDKHVCHHCGFTDRWNCDADGKRRAVHIAKSEGLAYT